MADIKECYKPSTHINVQHCAEFVPSLLYDFISWITSEKSYQEAQRSDSSDTSKDDLQTIALCHNIIAKNKHVRTPITLGLGLYVHH